MPIVDVRNQPTVIEIGPGAMVAEFTEELVTAQVLVGPTVVEFSWGELIPGPGLKGGGPFEGTVYIDQDIPGLPPTVEGVDTNDLFMMWDDSQQKHVKILASDFGGGGGDYIGENLGAGADVYKETDQVSDPRVHKFRSLISSDNSVSISQLANEIDFTVSAGGVINAPSIDEIGTVDCGCGSTTTLTPATMLPNLAVGDLMVWVFTQNGITVNGLPLSISPSTGWLPWRIGKGTGNADQQGYFSIWYKWATAADLLPATSYVGTIDPSAGNHICSSASAYRNAHLHMPLAGLAQTFQSTNSNFTPGAPVPAFAVGQSAICISCVATGGGYAGVDYPGGRRIGPAPEQSYWHVQSVSGVRDYHFHTAYHASVSINSDSNLIAGETYNSCMQAAGWTYHGLLFNGHSEQNSYFVSTGAGAIRHYAEYAVSLKAGQKYTLAVQGSCPHTGSHNPAVRSGLTYVDPAGVERGHVGPMGISAASLTLDPLNDLDDTWTFRYQDSSSSGIPSTAGLRRLLFFTASTDGVYLMRVNAGDGSSTPAWEWAGTGTENWRFASVVLKEGWVDGFPVYTPTAAAYEGSQGLMRLSPLTAWLDANGSFNYVVSTAVVPVNEALPPAQIRPSLGAESFFLGLYQTQLYDITGLKNRKGYFGSTGISRYAADRSIYPTVAGARRSYYFEVVVESPSDKLLFGVRPNGANGSHAGAAWHFENNAITMSDVAGTVTPTGGSGVALGDIFGCKVDFTVLGSVTVTFYRNGVVAGTRTLSIASGPYHNEEPWYAYITPVSWHYPANYSGVFRINLTGPFAYPVNGSIAYDYWGVNPPDAPSSTGTGVSVLGGTSTYPTIKSLVAGSNIEITDNVESVTIGALTKTITLPNIISDTASGTLSNYNPTGLGTCAGIRLTPSSATSIYKILDATDKRVLVLMNGSATYSITLVHDQDGGGGGYSGFKIACPNATDVVIPPFGSVWLMYNPNLITYGRWQVIAKT